MKYFFKLNLSVQLKTLLCLVFLLISSKNYAQDIEQCILMPSKKKLNLIGKKSNKKPIYFLNEKEVSEKAILGLSCNAVSSTKVLIPQEATAKYGKKGKNGAVLVSTKEKWKQRALVKLKNNATIYSYLKTLKKNPGFTFNINKALVVVDEKISNKKIIDSIPFKNLVGIKFLKATDKDALKYDNNAKNGVILIQTNKTYLDFLNKHNNFLFVIDGIPSNLQNAKSINPNKIKAIDILKDAAATAIYGSRGAKGVLLITLKKKTN